ncbi:c4-dicarboxylate-binding protein [Azospirillum brasilense]|uniref:TRAP transporter substrate-binding protein n=1 Tax=Azospirillum brasilense TaxID=192 RepID=UPI00190AF2ED|nr:TRAP transporter substrate-binding protein [Azospirillum brasilense]MBK3734286.1 c4-dicarboxylate-binding protein [Azospirillum brasilense]
MLHAVLKATPAAVLKAAAVAALVLAGGVTARAATVWDVSVPWPASEFHTVNAERFAKAVGEATKGQVTLTIHSGGSLGIRANESLRAVEDGAVPMAEVAGFLNVGDVPILGLEAIPFLVKDYAELRRLHTLLRPIWEAELAKRNQKILYVVPWPSQNFFTKTPIAKVADMKGVRMRTYDANTTAMVQRLGMVPLQLGNAEVVAALATGKVDAAMTAGSTAAAQKYWEFLKYGFNTNHLWASNLMTVNLDSWKTLSPQQQAAIEAVAAGLEPDFWTVSEGEHTRRMAELQAHGMTVGPIAPELRKALEEATADMTADFIRKVGGPSADVIAAFKK